MFTFYFIEFCTYSLVTHSCTLQMHRIHKLCLCFVGWRCLLLIKNMMLHFGIKRFSLARSACTCYMVYWCIDYQGSLCSKGGVEWYVVCSLVSFLPGWAIMKTTSVSMRTLPYSGWIPHDTVIRYCVFVAFFLNVYSHICRHCIARVLECFHLHATIYAKAYLTNLAW